MAKKKKQLWLEIPHVGQRLRLIDGDDHIGVPPGSIATILGYKVTGWPETELEMWVAFEDGRTVVVVHGDDRYELLYAGYPNGKATRPGQPTEPLPWLN